MIVISHPWEFVPKGSSQSNYHTSNNASGTVSATSANLISSSNLNSNKSSNAAIGSSGVNDVMMMPTTSQTNQPPQFYLHKSHLNRFYSNQNLNQRISLPEDNNSSLSDISFAYLHNRSPAIQNINFDSSVRDLKKKKVYYFFFKFVLNYIDRKMAFKTSKRIL